MKHIVWSSDFSLDDFREFFLEEYPDMTEDEMWESAYSLNDEYLDDARMNLNITLSQPILVLGDLGRWNGRVSGYKIIESGNIADCLYSNCDYNEWFVDERGDFRGVGAHHDGTDYYLYRVFKDEISDIQRENLLDKIYHGKATRTDITRKTRRIGDEINKVYGWEGRNA